MLVRQVLRKICVLEARLEAYCLGLLISNIKLSVFSVIVLVLVLWVMAAFELSTFVSDPTLGTFGECTKKDLHVIAEHYGISVSVSLRKAELKAFVFTGLVNQGVFSAPVSGAARLCYSGCST